MRSEPRIAKLLLGRGFVNVHSRTTHLSAETADCLTRLQQAFPSLSPATLGTTGTVKSKNAAALLKKTQEFVVKWFAVALRLSEFAKNEKSRQPSIAGFVRSKLTSIRSRSTPSPPNRFDTACGLSGLHRVDW